MDEDIGADAPRDNLERESSFELIRAETEGDGLTLTGYAAVFNSPTRIDSWEGKFDEIVARGAFSKTLSERTPVLMFNHGKHPLIADLPLGRFTAMKEDARGLYVEARLSDNWLIQPVRDAIAEGSISGMSFRFSVVKDTWQAAQRGGVRLRTLNEVRCPEAGPVVFPAYAETSVGVRSSEIALALLDPDIRVEVARALLLGTPLEAGHATSPGAATEDQEPTSATPVTPKFPVLRAKAIERGLA